MIFSSQIFLFLFLPITLAGYYFFNKVNFFQKKGKNCWLLLMSILFYAYGEPFYVYVLIVVSLFNWILSKLIVLVDYPRKKILLIIATTGNIFFLFIFKYLSFIIENINHIFHLSLFDPQLKLPIGISFFTFQAISYIIDVYRGDAEVTDTPLEIGVYLLFFPQLIAGPIVRYKSIANEIHSRKESIDDFAYGIEKLIIGIGKKC